MKKFIILKQDKAFKTNYFKLINRYKQVGEYFIFTLDRKVIKIDKNGVLNETTTRERVLSKIEKETKSVIYVNIVGDYDDEPKTN